MRIMNICRHCVNDVGWGVPEITEPTNECAFSLCNECSYFLEITLIIGSHPELFTWRENASAEPRHSFIIKSNRQPQLNPVSVERSLCYKYIKVVYYAVAPVAFFPHYALKWITPL